MKDILQAPLKIREELFSSECEDLVRKLLQRNPLERLGSDGGFKEIIEHPWFSNVDWDDVIKKRCHVHAYGPKKLKNKQYRISMDTLLPHTR